MILVDNNSTSIWQKAGHSGSSTIQQGTCVTVPVPVIPIYIYTQDTRGTGVCSHVHNVYYL